MSADIENDEKWISELSSKISKEEPLSICQPSSDTLNLVWETAERYSNNTEEFETFSLTAAASEQASPEQLTNHGKQWSISWEEISEADTNVFLQFKCKSEYIETYVGRAVDAQLGAEVFELGNIDQHGVTETKIPRHFLIHNPISIRIRPRS